MGAQQNGLKAFGIENWAFLAVEGCQGPKGQKLLPYNTQHRPTTTHFQVVANAVVLEDLFPHSGGGGGADRLFTSRPLYFQKNNTKKPKQIQKKNGRSWEIHTKIVVYSSILVVV